MAEVFSRLSAFSVFLAIAATGFLFLLISLVFGEIFEHFESEIGHDLGHGGPSFFSIRVLSVFITAFGGFGAIGTHYGLSVPASSALGFLSGVVFATAIYFFASFLFKQQATTEFRDRDLIGQSARVVVAIPSGGVGQVRCRIGEELVDKVARSASGAAIPENAVVRIRESLGEILIVDQV